MRETPFTGYAFSSTFCPQTGISSRYLKYHFFLRAEYRTTTGIQLIFHFQIHILPGSHFHLAVLLLYKCTVFFIFTMPFVIMIILSERV